MRNFDEAVVVLLFLGGIALIGLLIEMFKDWLEQGLDELQEDKYHDSQD